MKILLVEDDIWLGAALTTLLETHHYTVDHADDGQAGLTLATTVEYDLILLDVQVPQIDGIRLCQMLRSHGYQKPILLLTADDSDAVAIAGFDAGADDYIVKPCVPDVLLARIRTLLRRSGVQVSAKALPNTALLHWGTLCLDVKAGRVTVADQVIALTATEYSLLELFLRHPNRIFSRSVILDRLWVLDDAPSDRAIITHVKDLRKKLKAGGLVDDIIETVYGMGYRLKPAPPPLSLPTATATTAATPHYSPPSRVDQVLNRFRSALEAQVASLEQAKTALLAGTLDADTQQAARQTAHTLAGSLASFGYPAGSTLARSLEHLLMGDRPFSAEAMGRVSDLITALHQLLNQPPGHSALSLIAPTQTYRVLMIDDDARLINQLKAESKAWDLRLTQAANVTEARLQLIPPLPDVVLLDLSVPGADDGGLAFLHEILARSPDLPVIVLTGQDSLTDRLAVSRLGARQFLHKPATTEQIFRAIARVVHPQPSPDAKVLIVDDDPAMLTLLSNMLMPWGIDVTTLSEPQQFWDTLMATAPNLVLLDLEMPQISGLELCQVVRQDAQWEDLPLLVVTAHTDANSLQQAFAAGADDFITKPVLGPELVTRVLSRIERSRLHHALGNTEGMRNGGPSQ